MQDCCNAYAGADGCSGGCGLLSVVLSADMLAFGCRWSLQLLLLQTLPLLPSCTLASLETTGNCRGTINFLTNFVPCTRLMLPLGFVKTSNHCPTATKLLLHGACMHAQGMKHPARHLCLRKNCPNPTSIMTQDPVRVEEKMLVCSVCLWGGGGLFGALFPDPPPPPSGLP